MITRPMLATAGPVKFPALCTPKIDGVRCYVAGGKARTRSGKPVPNRFIRAWIERHCPDGFDGELTVAGGTVHDTAASVARRDGRPDFTFHVFDFVFSDGNDSAQQRADDLARLEFIASGLNRVHVILPRLIESQAALDSYLAVCLAEGFEGIVARDPRAPYVAGRSSAMVKVKTFSDGEAVVVGADGEGELAALIVEAGGERLRLGSGFTPRQRRELWRDRENLAGSLVTYRHHPGAVNREPVFAGIRQAFDV